MGKSFLDDEDELDLRPRRRSRSSLNEGAPERPRRSITGSGDSDGTFVRPVRRTRSEPEADQAGVDETSEAGGRKVRTRKSESGAQPVRRKITNEIHEMDDYEGFSGKGSSVIGYIALALVVVAAVVCSFKFLGMSIVTVIIIQLIMVAMGFFLRQVPGFIPVLLVFCILVVGMITNMTDIVLCGSATLLAAVTTLRD